MVKVTVYTFMGYLPILTDLVLFAKSSVDTTAQWRRTDFSMLIVIKMTFKNPHL